MLHQQWSFVTKEQLEKIPALESYYCLVTEQVAERIQEVPLELLEQLLQCLHYMRINIFIK